MSGRMEKEHSGYKRRKRPGENEFGLKGKWGKDINFKNQIEDIGISFIHSIEIYWMPPMCQALL